MSEQTLVYERPDQDVMARQTGALLSFAQSLLIDSPDMYQMAADELAGIKTQYKTLDARRKAITDPMNLAIKSTNDLFRAPLETLTNSEKCIKDKMISYSDEQERIAAAARRKAEDEARKERERIANEAAQREREAREASERLRVQAETEAAAGNEVAAEALQQQAAETTEAAHQEVSALVQASQVVAAAPVVVQMASAKGTAIKETWKAEVTNKAALIAHVAANPHLIELLMVNTTALAAQARSLKQALNIPGVRVYAEKSMSSRAA